MPPLYGKNNRPVCSLCIITYMIILYRVINRIYTHEFVPEGFLLLYYAFQLNELTCTYILRCFCICVCVLLQSALHVYGHFRHDSFFERVIIVLFFIFPTCTGAQVKSHFNLLLLVCMYYVVESGLLTAVAAF